MPIERRLSLRRGFSEQSQEELMGLFALPAGSLKQAAQHAMVLQALIGACALDDFSHDDQRAQATLGLVVGRRNVSHFGETFFGGFGRT
jgi:hypothetical protein